MWASDDWNCGVTGSEMIGNGQTAEMKKDEALNKTQSFSTVV